MIALHQRRILMANQNDKTSQSQESTKRSGSQRGQYSHHSSEHQRYSRMPDGSIREEKQHRYLNKCLYEWSFSGGRHRNIISFNKANNSINFTTHEFMQIQKISK